MRMTSLLLDARQSRPDTVAGIVEWFGAMQAQDNASALWSLGSRLPASTREDVEQALERREAIRTWPMRGTIHLVPPVDARWMLDLMGPRALAGARSRRANLGLSEQTADRGVEVLGAAMAGGRRLSRSQCLTVLAEAGVDATGQRGYHLLWYASQRGVTCIAPAIDGEQTFVLLDDWVPEPRQVTREEGLAIMAIRYFRSHGPTTRQDFVGWTGLSAADARLGIAAAGDAVASVEVGGLAMHVDPAALDRQGAATPVEKPGLVLALAGFDEYLLGYKDRALMLAAEHKQAIIPGGNGVFQWTLVRGGQVIGTWRRTPRSGRVIVDAMPLVEVEPDGRAAVEAAIEPYARFVGSRVEVRWPG